MAEESKKPEASAPVETPDADKPSYMTAEEFNKAATAREKRLEAKIEKLLSEKLAATIQPAAEVKEEPKSKKETEEQHTARIKALEARLAESDAKAKAEEAKRKRDEERNTLAQALNDKGITGPKARAAMALLDLDQQRIKRDESGAIKMRMQREGYEDLADVSAGLDEWLKTEEGKEFLPPRGAKGSAAAGGRAPGVGQHGNGKITKAQAGNILMDYFSAVQGGTITHGQGGQGNEN